MVFPVYLIGVFYISLMKAADGNNSGYIFEASGAAQADDDDHDGPGTARYNTILTTMGLIYPLKKFDSQ